MKTSNKIIMGALGFVLVCWLAFLIGFRTSLIPFTEEEKQEIIDSRKQSDMIHYNEHGERIN